MILTSCVSILKRGPCISLQVSPILRCNSAALFSVLAKMNPTSPSAMLTNGTRGAEPKQLAFSTALGISIGVFPIVGGAVFDASQYAFYGNEVLKEVYLGGLEEEDEGDDLPMAKLGDDEYLCLFRESHRRKKKTKEILSKQAVKIAKQVEEHERKGIGFVYLTGRFLSKGCLLLNSMIWSDPIRYREALFFD